MKFGSLRAKVTSRFRRNGWARTSAPGASTPKATARARLGGKGGEGKAVPYFMVRIRVSNGLLDSHQVRTIADVAERYARGVADLTVRQNVQLHWVTIEALPDLLETLWRAGLTTMGSCGDDTRNITGCPLAGVDGDELCDASPLVLEATRLLVGNPAFYNLPRKFKICITGCRVWCSYPEINDVGLTAVTRTVNGHPEVGFSLRVGGGLSTEPLFGQRLNAFVRWEQVIPVIQGVAEIFRDADVLRESRERARLKYLFLRHGWTVASFQAELERRIGFELDPMVAEDPPADIYRDHVGIHPQKQPGYSYVGAAVLRGRITAEQLRAAAELADRFASGELRTTNMQNLLIADVPNHRRRRTGARVGSHRTAAGRLELRAGRDCLHGHGVLQTRHHGNQNLHALAGRGAGRAPAGVRPAAEAERHRLPQQLRPALDCRCGNRGQEDQGGRQVEWMPITSVWVAPWAATKFCAPRRLSLRGDRGSRRHGAPAARLFGRRFQGENLRQFFAAIAMRSFEPFLPAEVIAVARDPSPGASRMGWRHNGLEAKACPAQDEERMQGTVSRSRKNRMGGAAVLEFWIGAAGGLLIGSTGVGLGLIMTPLLIVAGYSPAVAVGTGLGVSVVTKVGRGGARTFGPLARQGRLDPARGRSWASGWRGASLHRWCCTDNRSRCLAEAGAGCHAVPGSRCAA